MPVNKMNPDDMDEIKAFIRTVGEELSSTVATSRMEAIARGHVREEFKVLFKVDPESTVELRTFQANMAFMHRFRTISEKVGTTVILTVAALATGGIVTLFWNSKGPS